MPHPPSTPLPHHTTTLPSTHSRDLATPPLECRTLGTPDDTVWSGVSTLPDYKPTFPKWGRKSVGRVMPTLCAEGIDLLERLLTYEPAARITARAALSHPYFADLDRAALPVVYA